MTKARLRHAPESLITPQVQSSPLPHTPQLLHNYHDEFSNEKLSRLMTLFNGWLISNYKYATSDLCCHSLLAFEHSTRSSLTLNQMPTGRMSSTFSSDRPYS